MGLCASLGILRHIDPLEVYLSAQLQVTTL